MAYNSQKTREWDLNTANSGLFLNAEFNRIFENFAYFKSENSEFEGNTTFAGTVTANKQIVSTVTGSTAPIAVSSNELVVHLNADKVDGADKSIDDTFSGNSDESIPTEKAVKTYVDNRLPAGTVVQWPMDTPPAGWLECNGTAISRTVYNELYGAINVTYGTGDGSTTFNIPDYRGQFLRGWDHGAGTDPEADARKTVADVAGNYVGTVQEDAFQGHWHKNNADLGGGDSEICRQGAGGLQIFQYNQVREAVTDGENGDPRTSSETRPKNVSIMYIIKY